MKTAAGRAAHGGAAHGSPAPGPDAHVVRDVAGLRRARIRIEALVQVGLLALSAALTVLSLCAGEQWLTPAKVWAVLLGQGTGGAGFLVGELRLPRVAGAIVAGAGLGIAGAVTQSVLRNPLASPDIIGVTSGAGTASVLVLAGGSGLAFAEAGATLPGAAVVGGLLAGATVLLLSWGPRSTGHGLPSARVVLVGLGVNAGFGSLSYWVLLRADLPDLTEATIWLSGTLNQVRWTTLTPAAVVVAASGAIAVVAFRALAMLRLDDISVSALGIRPAPTQVTLVAVAVVLASAATAVAGPVPFVAFVAPQIAARLAQASVPNPMTSGATGAALLLTADLIARQLFPMNLPVGLVTAVFASPVLLWLLVRGGR